MTKHLDQEIMKISRLRNIFLKDKTETNRKTTKLKQTFVRNLSELLENYTWTFSI